MILKIISLDPRPIPYNVLKSKFFRQLRLHYPDKGVPDELFYGTLTELKEKYLVGSNAYDKWFIDYPDFKPNGITGAGFLDIDKTTGNGFITVKEKRTDFKKSSHFVHKKNLNGAKKGNYVKFVELETSFKKKRANDYALIDASILEILEEPKG
ncbi:hypothetical protein [Candidatus Mycoplasma haematominutum]|uniref:Ribonuclease R n=1 Tax=Candidatus Mycoplasma haematominutum 'Birmingham 1' TaxID=1116213 RepID=G8C3L6_9MOLU|nr:hypothetical protein [Candidatus Mycoplasma haematominutum]CCE66914.1 ribonuclease R, fragment [Candidatus Mycoplasma haematominutum 'Birmingham 1']